eukprot:6212679-Pleurochrysis_carterae.AAC.3
MKPFKRHGESALCACTRTHTSQTSSGPHPAVSEIASDLHAHSHATSLSRTERSPPLRLRRQEEGTQGDETSDALVRKSTCTHLFLFGLSHSYDHSFSHCCARPLHMIERARVWSQSLVTCLSMYKSLNFSLTNMHSRYQVHASCPLAISHCTYPVVNLRHACIGCSCLRSARCNSLYVLAVAQAVLFFPLNSRARCARTQLLARSVRQMYGSFGPADGAPMKAATRIVFD